MGLSPGDAAVGDPTGPWIFGLDRPDRHPCAMMRLTKDFI